MNCKNIIKGTCSLTFNRNGYDPLIDYLKGLCILFIVIQHSIPTALHHYTMFALWGRLAVPIFLLIQVFHTYKKITGGGKISIQIEKSWKRVVKPFIVVQILLVFIDVVLFQKSFGTVISDLCHNGGMGSGGYYPWIYIQFAVLLVLLVPTFRKYKKQMVLFFIFALASQLLELLCCLFQMPEWIFRLCAIRYFFIIYLGYILATQGFDLNKKTFAIGIVSLICLCFFVFKDVNLRPFFYTGIPAWRTCHWVNYIYVCYILLFVLRWTYEKLQSRKRIVTWIQDMGKYSYEIFMFQMIYFHVCKTLIPDKGGMISQIVYMIAAVVLCTVPIVIYKNHSCKIIE